MARRGDEASNLAVTDKGTIARAARQVSAFSFQVAGRRLLFLRVLVMPATLPPRRCRSRCSRG
ncbi:MAG: hypothetical protein ACI8W7_000542 [Gammaproteobacteria bacterium]|jgi:hypothetical protein